MTDLILRSFNGLAQQKSYGNKTLQENFESADRAIASVAYTERIWDRSRSQFMIKFITCSNADGWLRIRQISAEMSSKRKALMEGKFAYVKTITEAKIKRKEILEQGDDDKKLLLEIEAAEFDFQATELLIRIEGALKEIQTLGLMHSTLKEKLVGSDGDITEAEFEKGQAKSHIKRAVSQAIRNVKEVGKIKEGNNEYLEQCGLNTTSVLRDIFVFLKEEEQSNATDNSLLHTFLDDMANKYGDVHIQRAEWLSFNPEADNNLVYTP